VRRKPFSPFAYPHVSLEGTCRLHHALTMPLQLFLPICRLRFENNATSGLLPL
jgi:hypothetical protein